MTTREQLHAIIKMLGLIDLGDAPSYLDEKETSEAAGSVEESTAERAVWECCQQC
jgi:hypothetical protein